MAFWDTAYGWVLKCVGWLLVFLAPIRPMLITALVLTAADMFFGIWAARKQGFTITSEKWRRTPVKLVGYFAGLIFSYGAEKYMLPDIPVVKGMAGLIASTELLSLYEKLAIITGVPFADFARKLFNKAPSNEPPPQ